MIMWVSEEGRVMTYPKQKSKERDSSTSSNIREWPSSGKTILKSSVSKNTGESADFVRKDSPMLRDSFTEEIFSPLSLKSRGEKYPPSSLKFSPKLKVREVFRLWRFLLRI